MRKLDLKKQFKALYNPPKKDVVVVDVPRLSFLMVDGTGDPNTAPEFQEAMEALYGVSYTLKFMMKMGRAQVDYPVMALEGLWWVEGVAEFGPDALEKRDDWQWTAMIMQPDIITADLVNQAMQKVREKKDPPALTRLRLQSFEEGRCAQTMHIGPYSEEGPTVQRVHEFIAANGWKLRGKHHEIYLSDPRRAKPERMKTVIRQPFG